MFQLLLLALSFTLISCAHKPEGHSQLRNEIREADGLELFRVRLSKSSTFLVRSTKKPLVAEEGDLFRVEIYLGNDISPIQCKVTKEPIVVGTWLGEIHSMAKTGRHGILYRNEPKFYLTNKKPAIASSFYFFEKDRRTLYKSVAVDLNEN